MGIVVFPFNSKNEFWKFPKSLKYMYFTEPFLRVWCLLVYSTIFTDLYSYMYFIVFNNSQWKWYFKSSGILFTSRLV